jgi:hypothetical protein
LAALRHLCENGRRRSENGHEGRQNHCPNVYRTHLSQLQCLVLVSCKTNARGRMFYVTLACVGSVANVVPVRIGFGFAANLR